MAMVNHEMLGSTLTIHSSMPLVIQIMLHRPVVGTMDLWDVIVQARVPVVDALGDETLLLPDGVRRERHLLR